MIFVRAKRMLIILLTAICLYLTLVAIGSIGQAGSPVLIKGFMTETGPDWECHCPAENLYWDCFCKIIK